MATLIGSNDLLEVPKLPSGSVKDFIPYLTENPTTPIQKLLEPYKAFEGELRKIYAQQPEHKAIQDGTVNLIPVFDGHEKDVTIRARSLDAETEEERSKYILSLSKEERKENGAPAIVASLKEFQQNFSIFSESSLADLDWSNLVVAGSACTTCLLPVPPQWAENKRKLREYYHEKLAPASDVDIFLYGLNEEQALQKIKQIERNIKDSILSEVTTIRTKNAITIASQNPIRHVQIVLRLYNSISEIITGFDVDCACAAYDGKQVYAAPRALAAFMTQANTIDLTRRSPSYENRLSKYSHRGFEVHWPLLDRSRVDPTIFERSFGRTQGLARLLILEKLPKNKDREDYADQRRAERGRPAINRGYRSYTMSGNIKDNEEDEVAEWVDQEDVASYHTMAVPYGPKYNASKINRLLYAKDLLLNAEWNAQKNRDVYLHRHPCFFGTAEEVLEDCCGYCPVPKTDEEFKIAEEESKTMVSGPLKFMTSNPGQQMVGSFNPITDDEWTTMAYVGDTARLCQAIVDKDLEHVEDWCSQEGVDVDRRDYTGRTPLHLACMVSSPEVVKCLVDHGARLIARLVDGRTALHISAARGNSEIIKILMNRSLANEEEEDVKEELRRAQRKAKRVAAGESNEDPENDENRKGDEKEDDDEEDGDDKSSDASEITQESEEGSDSMTMGSFVKVDNSEAESKQDAAFEDSSEDPDVYEIDVIAWDFGLSPLHYAILHGHEDIIDLLVSEYGADVLLPVKLVEPGTSTPRGAIMTVLLTLALPTEKAKAITKQLLGLGATSAQGDQNSVTLFHHVVAQDSTDILDVLLENDRPVAMSVLNNTGSDGNQYNPSVHSPLTSAIEKGFSDMVAKLLKLGSTTTVDYNGWVKTYLATNRWAKNYDAKTVRERYEDSVVQPIILAAGKSMATTVEELLVHGADPATLEKAAHQVVRNPSAISYIHPQSLLDIVEQKLDYLQGYKEPITKSPEKLEDESAYTSGYKGGKYQYFTALKDFEKEKESNKAEWDSYNKRLQENIEDGVQAKKEAVSKLIEEFTHVKQALIEAGAKTFVEMHPDIPKRPAQHTNRNAYVSPDTHYQTNIFFRTPDENPYSRQGYLELFEAAWDNNLEKIKSLTLAKWEIGNSGMQAPLKIGIEDHNEFTPFSIAVLRGHYDLARKIVEICAAQYHKDDGISSRKRWTLKTSSDNGDSEDDSDYESDSHQPHDHLPIFSELVSDQFTVDNLGEVASIVKSDILPLTMIDSPCRPGRFLGAPPNETESSRCSLLQYAVKTDNMEIFKFIMQLGAEQQALLAEEDDDQKCYSVDIGIFKEAMIQGRVTMLAEMIKASGVGFPMNYLIKKSGIELQSKPKYYQGLSVGGKKRADWAQAPGENRYVAEDSTPPLLQSAKFGNIESVEWFMSNAPTRRYKEFAEANKNDKRIKTLQSTNNFEKIINTWLNVQSELVLHCAVLHTHDEKDSAKHIDLLKYIVSVSPASLEHKSSEGWTPLQVAVFAENNDAISYLISIGANQRSRDKMGRNMIHSMVATQSGSTRTRHEDVESMIKLFDKQAVEEMLVERSNSHSGALTPLGLWMFSNKGYHKQSGVIDVLTKYSTGEDLEMINGEGDLPLHVAVRQNLTSITAYLLSVKPSLLYRENATGRTPLEMARDAYTTSQVDTPLCVAPGHSYWNTYQPGEEANRSLADKSASDFVPKKDEIEENQKRTWEICNEVDQKMDEGGKKRRLVSLFEANEVAKRVAARGGRRSHVVNGGLVDGDVKKDIISQWL